LIHAAREGHLAVVTLLLDRGADAGAPWKEWTPLRAAQERGHAAVAEYLRAHGARWSITRPAARPTGAPGPRGRRSGSPRAPPPVSHPRPRPRRRRATPPARARRPRRRRRRRTSSEYRNGCSRSAIRR